MEAEKWTHLAASFDGDTNIITLYVDGVQVANGLSSSQPITSGPALVYTRAGAPEHTVHYLLDAHPDYKGEST